MGRGGVEEYDGRPIQAIDNGNVKASALQSFANTPRPLRGLDGHKITQYEWAKAGVITNAENRGFPAACNQGLRAARGDYLILVNNDAVVTDAWLDMLAIQRQLAPPRHD